MARLRAVAVIGHQNAGKTRLIAALVRHLSRRGLRVGTLKHARHGFLADTPGKDSHAHFNAGAAVTVLASPEKTAVFRRVRREPRLRDLLALFAGCDLVLVEGYRASSLPKIEVWRRAVAPRPMAAVRRLRVRALVTDDPHGLRVPSLSPRATRRIADFVEKEIFRC
jgi:molybdopterin-guanine dinucleotide biosynthesis protein B